MTSPRRLLDEGTPFERDVLDSAHGDVGPADGFKRTLAAVSFGAAAGTVASVAPPGAAAGTTAGATATSASASAGAAVFVKWLALAVVIGGAVTAAWRPWSPRKPAGAAAIGANAAMVSSPHSASLPVPLAILPEPGAPSSTASPQVVLEPAAPRRAPEPSRVAAAARLTASAGGADLTAARVSGFAEAAQPTLVDPASVQAAAGNPPVAPEPKARQRPVPVLYGEVAALEGVRAALDQGDSRDALRRLDAYDATFPRSVLAEEATVLRIDALSQVGDSAAAASLARSFLVANPSSPHAPHLRALTSGVHNP